MKILFLLILISSCASSDPKNDSLETDFDSEYHNEYIIDEYENYMNQDHP